MATTFKDILAAAGRLQGKIHYTPVLTCSTINKLSGRNIYFKCENLQKTGAFKVRGALNAVLRLTEENPSVKGVITHSSGNHGQALAWAADVMRIPCAVVVPENTPPAKKNAITSYGARLVLCKPTPQDREETCQKVATEEGYMIIPPFDHYDVIAGQGTIAVEVLEQISDVDAIFVPISGGGMTSGISIATKAIKPSVKVFAVEPEGKDLGKSLQRERRMWTGPPRLLDTIADAIRFQEVGHLTFPILVENVEKQVFTVSDEQMVSAMKLVWERMKLVIEISTASGVAAILSEEFKNLPEDIRNVCVILCGGNADLDRIPWMAK